MCRRCRSCTPFEFKSSECTATDDRTCIAFSICNPVFEVETAQASPTNDRDCTAVVNITVVLPTPHTVLGKSAFLDEVRNMLQNSVSDDSIVSVLDIDYVHGKPNAANITLNAGVVLRVNASEAVHIEHLKMLSNHSSSRLQLALSSLAPAVQSAGEKSSTSMSYIPIVAGAVGGVLVVLLAIVVVVRRRRTHTKVSVVLTETASPIEYIPTPYDAVEAPIYTFASEGTLYSVPGFANPLYSPDWDNTVENSYDVLSSAENTFYVDVSCAIGDLPVWKSGLPNNATAEDC
jgi:hypothetical protein